MEYPPELPSVDIAPQFTPEIGVREVDEQDGSVGADTESLTAPGFLLGAVGDAGEHRLSAGDATTGILCDGERLRVVLRAATVLCGLELGVVAAQAREVRNAMVEEDPDSLGPWLMILDGGHELALDRWDRVDDPARLVESLVQVSGSPYPWIGRLAIRCLLSTPPQARRPALKGLRTVLEETEGLTQLNATWGVLALSANTETARELADHPATPVRRAVASMLRPSARGRVRHLLVSLLADPDIGVREAAVRSVEAVGIADEVQQELEASLSGASGWDCMFCGTSNTPDADGCVFCRQRPPQLPEAVDSALAARPAG